MQVQKGKERLGADAQRKEGGGEGEGVGRGRTKLRLSAAAAAVSPVARPAAQPAARPAARPAAPPAAQPAAPPAAKPAARPVAPPAAKPVAPPAARPAVQPGAKPGARPAAQPAEKPIARPAARLSVGGPGGASPGSPAASFRAKLSMGASVVVRESLGASTRSRTGSRPASRSSSPSVPVYTGSSLVQNALGRDVDVVSGKPLNRPYDQPMRNRDVPAKGFVDNCLVGPDSLFMWPSSDGFRVEVEYISGEDTVKVTVYENDYGSHWNVCFNRNDCFIDEISNYSMTFTGVLVPMYTEKALGREYLHAALNFMLKHPVGAEYTYCDGDDEVPLRREVFTQGAYVVCILCDIFSLTSDDGTQILGSALNYESKLGIMKYVVNGPIMEVVAATPCAVFSRAGGLAGDRNDVLIRGEERRMSASEFMAYVLDSMDGRPDIRCYELFSDAIAEYNALVYGSDVSEKNDGKAPRYLDYLDGSRYVAVNWLSLARPFKVENALVMVFTTRNDTRHYVLFSRESCGGEDGGEDSGKNELYQFLCEPVLESFPEDARAILRGVEVPELRCIQAIDAHEQCEVRANHYHEFANNSGFSKEKIMENTSILVDVYFYNLHTYVERWPEYVGHDYRISGEFTLIRKGVEKLTFGNLRSVAENDPYCIAKKLVQGAAFTDLSLEFVDRFSLNGKLIPVNAPNPFQTPARNRKDPGRRSVGPESALPSPFSAEGQLIPRDNSGGGRFVPDNMVGFGGDGEICVQYEQRIESAPEGVTPRIAYMPLQWMQTYSKYEGVRNIGRPVNMMFQGLTGWFPVRCANYKVDSKGLVKLTDVLPKKRTDAMDLFKAHGGEAKECRARNTFVFMDGMREDRLIEPEEFLNVFMRSEVKIKNFETSRNCMFLDYAYLTACLKNKGIIPGIGLTAKDNFLIYDERDHKNALGHLRTMEAYTERQSGSGGQPPAPARGRPVERRISADVAPAGDGGVALTESENEDEDAGQGAAAEVRSPRVLPDTFLSSGQKKRPVREEGVVERKLKAKLTEVKSRLMEKSSVAPANMTNVRPKLQKLRPLPASPAALAAAAAAAPQTPPHVEGGGEDGGASSGERQMAASALVALGTPPRPAGRGWEHPATAPPALQKYRRGVEYKIAIKPLPALPADGGEDNDDILLVVDEEPPAASRGVKASWVTNVGEDPPYYSKSDSFDEMCEDPNMQRFRKGPTRLMLTDLNSITAARGIAPHGDEYNKLVDGVLEIRKKLWEHFDPSKEQTPFKKLYDGYPLNKPSVAGARRLAFGSGGSKLVSPRPLKDREAAKARQMEEEKARQAEEQKARQAAEEAAAAAAGPVGGEGGGASGDDEDVEEVFTLYKTEPVFYYFAFLKGGVPGCKDVFGDNDLFDDCLREYNLFLSMEKKRAQRTEENDEDLCFLRMTNMACFDRDAELKSRVVRFMVEKGVLSNTDSYLNPLVSLTYLPVQEDDDLLPDWFNPRLIVRLDRTNDAKITTISRQVTKLDYMWFNIQKGWWTGETLKEVYEGRKDLFAKHKDKLPEGVWVGFEGEDRHDPVNDLPVYFPPTCWKRVEPNEYPRYLASLPIEDSQMAGYDSEVVLNSLEHEAAELFDRIKANPDNAKGLLIFALVSCLNRIKLDEGGHYFNRLIEIGGEAGEAADDEAADDEAADVEAADVEAADVEVAAGGAGEAADVEELDVEAAEGASSAGPGAGGVFRLSAALDLYFYSDKEELVKRTIGTLGFAMDICYLYELYVSTGGLESFQESEKTRFEELISSSLSGMHAGLTFIFDRVGVNGIRRLMRFLNASELFKYDRTSGFVQQDMYRLTRKFIEGLFPIGVFDSNSVPVDSPDNVVKASSRRICELVKIRDCWFDNVMSAVGCDPVVVDLQ